MLLVSDLPGLWSTMGQIQYLKSPKRNLFRTEDGNIMLRGDNQTDGKDGTLLMQFSKDSSTHFR